MLAEWPRWPPKLRTEHAEVSKGGPLTRWQGFGEWAHPFALFLATRRTQVFTDIFSFLSSLLFT